MTENSLAKPPRKESQLELDSLKLLSWNIYMLPPMIGFKGKKKRAKAIAKKLSESEYDVIVFSEAFNRHARKRIKEGIRESFPYFQGPAFRKKFSLKTSSGIWIASKHPMKEMGKIVFKRKSGFDNRMARKGALMVQIDKNGQKFDIIGTHMNNLGRLELRLHQLKQIKEELIDEYNQTDVPVIVAGDYNVYRYEEPGSVDSVVAVLEMDDYKLEGNTPYTYDYENNSLAYGKISDEIDYVFYHPGELDVHEVKRIVPVIEKKWKKNRKHLSDHNPLEFLLYYKP